MGSFLQSVGTARGLQAPPLLAVAGAVAGVAVVGVSLRSLLKVPKLPLKDIESWARELRGAPHDRPPLQGYTAFVTGATAGIGHELSAVLFAMGATVVLLGRNLGKLKSTAAELRSRHPEAGGTIDFEVVDTADLESVAAAAKRLAARYEQIDLLVNNAGMHYRSGMLRLWAPCASPQGYDLCFATNYLGHFLLTDLLGPRLRATPGSRLVHVSSTYHWQVSGVDLLPSCDHGSALESAPWAAQADVKWPWWRLMQRNAAYGNSKLAQILHGRALRRAWGPDVRALSCCPLFVQTGMTRGLGPVLNFSFDATSGLYAILGAALMPAKLLGDAGDFVTNGTVVSQVFPTRLLTSWPLSRTRLRELFTHACAGLLLLLQRRSYGCHLEATSPESHDAKLADAFYKWSLLAVSPYTSGSSDQLSGLHKAAAGA